MMKFVIAIGFAAFLAVQGFCEVSVAAGAIQQHNYTTAHAAE